jgi:hypothetical protein
VRRPGCEQLQQELDADPGSVSPVHRRPTRTSDRASFYLGVRFAGAATIGSGTCYARHWIRSPVTARRRR